MSLILNTKIPQQKTIVSVIVLLATHIYCTSQIKDSLELFKIFSNYRSPSNNTEQAEIFFQSFLNDTFNSKQYPYFMGMASEELGIIKCNKGEFQSALESFEASYHYSAVANDSIGMATSKNWIGLVHQNLGNQDLAIQYYLEAFKLAEAINETRLMIVFQSNIASLYFSMGDYEASLRYQRRAYSFAKNIKDQSIANLAKLCNDFCVVFCAMNLMDSAKFYVNTAKLHADATSDTSSIIEAHLNKFRIYKLENPKYAYTELQKGTILAIKNPHLFPGNQHFKLIEAFLLNSDYHMLQNNLDSSKKYLNESLKLGIEIGSLEAQKSCYENLMHIAKLQRDYKTAFDMSERLKECTDSLFTIEKDKRTQQLSILHETEKKEKEILKSHNELRKKDLFVQATSIFILIVMIGGYFFFLSLRLKKKIEQQEVLLNERKRISTELHDDVGAQLSIAKLFLDHLKARGLKEKDNTIIDKSIMILDDSINHLRNMMQELENSTLEKFGYIAAIEELIRKINPIKNIQFEITSNGFSERLEKKIEHNLFRITQELINNTLKHSSATAISIYLTKNPNNTTFVYEDNGEGFEMISTPYGNGLENMRQRVNAINGYIVIDTSVNSGFKVIITLDNTTSY